MIKERIIYYLNNKGIVKEAFYRKVGVSASNFKGPAMKSEIGGSVIVKILSIYKDINPEWLLTGEGEMLRSSEVNTPIVNYTSAGNPYYNVDFQGGFELLLNDQTINPEYYINFEPFNQSGAVWCNVSGKSMEPEISNGDKIVLKEVKDWKTFLPMGEIYGVITDEFRTIKRIRKATNPENWLLVPSNPDYDKQEIPIKKIRAIFQVLGSVKML